MYKILVVLIGLLNTNEAKVTITSDVTFDTKKACVEAMALPAVIKDIQSMSNHLRELGYSDVSVEKYDCVAEERKT